MPTALVQALAYQADAGCLSKPHEIKGKRKIFLFFRKKISVSFHFFSFTMPILRADSGRDSETTYFK